MRNFKSKSAQKRDELAAQVNTLVDSNCQNLGYDVPLRVTNRITVFKKIVTIYVFF